jgi:hypothetical protein
MMECGLEFLVGCGSDGVRFYVLENKHETDFI